ncbi:MAG: hypothetical protein PHP26_10055, partial [Syntrophomonas sp.]|nr:hypothetical protein [Syntrophomonas sp.]
VAMFEPLPQEGLLDKMEQMVMNGGNVIWFSAPPLLDSKGENCSERWQRLFGVNYKFDEYIGETAPGKKVTFLNTLRNLPEQVILTDFLVDHIYPVTCNSSDVEIISKVEDKIAGTRFKKGKGSAIFCGFRPRDDQSASLGYESRTLFEILNAIGAYPSSGLFSTNDNPTYVSRTSDFFATRFPNGTTAIVKHYRTHRENWEGGFSRNEESDAKALAVNPLPSDLLDIQNLKINGHEITYKGKMNLSFRTDNQKRLSAFIGNQCTGITIDGINYQFAGSPINIAFIPTDSGLSTYSLRVEGEEVVTLPVPRNYTKAILRDGSKNIDCQVKGRNIVFTIDPTLSGKWLTLTYK